MSREHFEQVLKEKFDNLIDYRVCSNGDGEYMAWDMQVAWFSWQAATSAMEAKCAELAAENAGLKDFLHSRVDESICDKHIKTPATDAYRNELRAQGIEMAAKSDQFSMWVQQGLRSFAIGVRQGGERELSDLERNVLECAAVIAKDRERGGAAQ